MSVLGVLIVVAIGLFGVLLVFGGGQMLLRRQTGDRLPATVTDCVDSGTSRNRQTRCVGTWTVDGVVRTGTVQGATSDQEGKTIEVTVEGDTAYSRHIALPLMLVGLGLLPVAFSLVLLRGMLRKPAPSAPAEGTV